MARAGEARHIGGKPSDNKSESAKRRTRDTANNTSNRKPTRHDEHANNKPTERDDQRAKKRRTDKHTAAEGQAPAQNDAVKRRPHKAATADNGATALEAGAGGVAKPTTKPPAGLDALARVAYARRADRDRKRKWRANASFEQLEATRTREREKARAWRASANEEERAKKREKTCIRMRKWRAQAKAKRAQKPLGDTEACPISGASGVTLGGGDDDAALEASDFGIVHVLAEPVD